MFTFIQMLMSVIFAIVLLQKSVCIRLNCITQNLCAYKHQFLSCLTLKH